MFIVSAFVSLTVIICGSLAYPFPPVNTDLPEAHSSLPCSDDIYDNFVKNGDCVHRFVAQLDWRIGMLKDFVNATRLSLDLPPVQLRDIVLNCPNEEYKTVTKNDACLLRLATNYYIKYLEAACPEEDFASSSQCHEKYFGALGMHHMVELDEKVNHTSFNCDAAEYERLIKIPNCEKELLRYELKSLNVLVRNRESAQDGSIDGSDDEQNIFFWLMGSIFASGVMMFSP